MGEFPSGQREQTVNLSRLRFGGSNPPSPTIKETSFVYQGKRGFLVFKKDAWYNHLDKSGFVRVVMLKISFIELECFFTAVWLLCRIIVWIRQCRINWKREAVLLLMYINLAVIIRFTFFPMSCVNGSVQPLIYDASTAFPFRVNLIPFMNLFDYDSRRDLLLNVIGNTAMFIPSGIFLPIIYKKLNSFWKVVSAGALISLCIEFIQLPFSVRASDVDDLILNVLGVAIGYGIYSAVKHLNR